MSAWSPISPALRDRVRGLAVPIATALGRLGLTPNQVTLIGFGIAIVAAWAATSGAWLAAGILVLAGGVFDLFDGALARATGKDSRLGAFYDSVFDRWGEGIIYVGIAWGAATAGFTPGSILAATAMASAFMVSYARARSESLGFTPGTRMAAVGLAPREVRIVILTAGLLAVGIVGPVGPWTFEVPADLSLSFAGPTYYRSGDIALSVPLALIALLATITTIQRILHVRAQATRQANQDNSPSPQSEEHGAR